MSWNASAVMTREWLDQTKDERIRRYGELIDALEDFPCIVVDPCYGWDLGWFPDEGLLICWTEESALGHRWCEAIAADLNTMAGLSYAPVEPDEYTRPDGTHAPMFALFAPWDFTLLDQIIERLQGLYLRGLPVEVSA
jgi:hypothetical protein